MKAAQTIVLDDKEYVILPKADYLRLTADAFAHAGATIGATLKRAREAAGLTQAQLAQRLGKTRTQVSGAESGWIRVSDRYVAAVTKACGQPGGRPLAATKKPQKRAGRPKDV
jgi:DNA-binding XRE family transcriptional regulator